MLKAEPENPSRYYQVAILAHQNDSVDYALDVVNRAIEKFGDQLQFTTTKGILLAEKKDFDGAERLLRPILDADSSIMNKLNLANVLADQDSRPKKEEARRLYLDIKEQVGNQYNIDSLLTELEKDLK